MKKPAFQFYIGDWLKDTALRCCSPEARGIWIDLICLMHESPQRGVLRTKNCSKFNAISIKNLSNSIAGCKERMIQELIDNGVVRVARKDGALYSKRMIYDELHHKHKAENGQKGGQAKPKQNPSKPEAKCVAKMGSSSSSSSSSSNKEGGGNPTPVALQPKKTAEEIHKLRIEEKSFGKFCTLCGKSPNEGKVIWRERLPFCALHHYEKWKSEQSIKVAAI